jgi:signal peptidase
MWALRLGFALLLVAVIGLFLAPRLLGWELQVVLSGSMGDALPAGSVSFVQPVVPQSLQVGDLLVYELPRDRSQQVTHRIVERRGEGAALEFRARGDANKAPDDYWIPASNVIGTVWGHIPYVGYVVPYVRTPVGYLILVVAPAAIIIYGEIKRILAAIRKQRHRQERFWT